MKTAQPTLRTTRASYEIWKEEKLFLSSEGADIAQTLYETGASIAAESVGNGEQQIRTYPGSGGRSQNTAGWEYALRWDFVANAPRIADEAVALLTAKQCPQGIRTSVILSSNQLMLQCHESCGHPIELHRALGTEAAFAGTSFLTTDRLGSFRYGSEHVTIAIGSTRKGGLGTFGYDDEGVPASEGWAVKDGIFVGYLMSRETAASLGTGSNGTMRADGWARLPLIRMTNVSVMPGSAGPPEDLVADTDDGISADTTRSWPSAPVDREPRLCLRARGAVDLRRGPEGRRRRPGRGGGGGAQRRAHAPRQRRDPSERRET